MHYKIPLSVPKISGNEWKYIKECLDTSWISTAGKYVDLFEKRIEKYTGANHAISCINGTSALHISLILSGVNSGDEVIVPTVSFIAPINAISYCKANPIFMDVDENYLIDIDKTIEFLDNHTATKKNKTYNLKTKKLIKAIIVVHVYGRSVSLEKLKKICRKKYIALIEDAAESLGNFYIKGSFKGKHTGTIGDFGALSFNGNKIVTSGGGGMILTNNKKLANKAKYLTTTAKDNSIEFIHNEVGYNYRLTNIQAALGLAQLEKINYFIDKKSKIYFNYIKYLKGNNNILFKKIPENAKSNYWLNLIEIKNFKNKKQLLNLVRILNNKGIETRPIWHLNHLQKKFKSCQKYKITKANKLINKTLCLPSSVDLSLRDIKRIVIQLNG